MSNEAAVRAGTVTVVFTDLVDSTALRQSLGDDRADELRREHDRLVREACEARGGTEVKSLGDGFMLVFGAAAEAVGAAVAMQQSVDRASRRSPDAPDLRIRVGVSAGDVIWEDGDCFGTPVVEASRLCTAAAPGQILLSDVVRVLAGSRGGHRYSTVGPIELKGLTEPVPASEVVWEADIGEPAFELPPALTTASQVGFVGRVAERDRLVAAWKEAAAGARRITFVSGEPGVGKTRLASELASAAHVEGAILLYGRCDEDLGVPYQPFVEALESYIAACPPEQLVEQTATYGGDLVRLVPQLADRVPSLPEPLHADPETERYRLFAAVTAFFGSIVATHPVVLVLDDLHWAAKPTLLLLRHLARADWSGPLLIVGTYRDTDLSRTHPLAEMLADLRRESDVERIPLHGLDAQEVAEFLAAAAGHELDDEGAELARMIHDETEGNPFFMGQVLRHLVESGSIIERDGRWVRSVAFDEIGIPEGVREVVGRRLARLQTSTNEILTAAAVIGRDFDRDVLSAVVGDDAEAVLDALEEAEEARLIESGEGRRGRYAFVHALVRSTLYEEVLTTRRLRLHKRIAEALEARDVDAHLDELAYHFAEAAALGEPEKAVEYGRRAAESALARLAYEKAAVDYERVIAALDPESAEHRGVRAELLLDLGRVLWSAGERKRAREHLAEAAVIADELDRPDLLIVAAVLRGGGSRGWVEAGTVDPEIVRLLEDGLRRLPDNELQLRAMALARLSRELYFLPAETERRIGLIHQAIELARGVGDPATLAYVLNCSHWGYLDPGSSAEREAMAREVIALCGQTGDRSLEAAALSYLVGDLLEQGKVDEARAESARERELTEELRQPELLWAAVAHDAMFATVDGRFDDAQRLADEALALGEQAEIESALQMYGVHQFALRRFLGGIEELVPLIEAMVEQWPLVPAWRSGLAYAYRELGDRERAREQLDIISSDYEAYLPYDGNWMVGVAILCTVCDMLDDEEQAAVLYEQFVRHENEVVTVGLPVDVLGSVHHFLMLLAGTMRRWDDFERHAAEALARNKAMGLHGWLATTQVEQARILAMRGHDGDPARARDLLNACLKTCDELGMPALANRARLVVEQLDA